MADFEAWLVFLILVVNVVGELQRKRTLAASRGFLAAARLSCLDIATIKTFHCWQGHNIIKNISPVILLLKGIRGFAQRICVPGRVRLSIQKLTGAGS